MLPAGEQNAPGCTPCCPDGGFVVGLGLGIGLGLWVVGFGAGMLVDAAFGFAAAVVAGIPVDSVAGVTAVVGPVAGVAEVAGPVAGVVVTESTTGRVDWSVGSHPASRTDRTARPRRVAFGRT